MLEAYHVGPDDASPRNLDVMIRTLALAFLLLLLPVSISMALTTNQQAPVLKVSGQTISWTKVGTVTSYVLATKVDGTTKYSTVGCCSTTPPVQAGKTVAYGLRTNVTGSAWAQEVSITYSAPTPPPPTGAFRVGIAGDYGNNNSNLTDAADLGAKLLRKEFTSGPQAWMDSFFRQAALQGVTVLPLINSSQTPSGPTAHDAYAARFKDMALRFGPGGSFWAANPDLNASLAPVVWEITNEPYIGYLSGPYNPGNYAQLVRRVSEVVRPVAAWIKLTMGVDMSFFGPTNNGAAWIEPLYAAVPDLNRYFDVVAVHLYAGNADTCDPNFRWCFRRVERIKAKMDSFGALDKRYWVTEIGINTGGADAVSEATQASYIEKYVTKAKSYGYIDAMTVYRYRDYCNNSADKECFFGVKRYDGSPKPAYTTLKNLIAANP